MSILVDELEQIIRGTVTDAEASREDWERAIERVFSSSQSVADFDFYFDCCGARLEEGDTIYNVGDSIDVVIYCKDCYSPKHNS